MKLNWATFWGAVGAIAAVAALWGVFGPHPAEQKPAGPVVVLNKLGSGPDKSNPPSDTLPHDDHTVIRENMKRVQAPPDESAMFEDSLRTVIEGAKTNWSAWDPEDSETGKPVVNVPDLTPDTLKGVLLTNWSTREDGALVVIIQTQLCPASMVNDLKTSFKRAVQHVLANEPDWTGIAPTTDEDGNETWENEAIDVTIKIGLDQDADTSKREPNVYVYGHTS